MDGTSHPNPAANQAPPYFDVLFTRLQNNEPATTVAFGRHVHWGYWGDPDAADGSAEDYAVAAEKLCRRICDAAQIQDGQRILDVGCGFGGTIASLNERFSNLDMVGVNIDPRQLQRAAETVHSENGNQIEFIEADGCDLPLASESFDVVLAVESIFHFPDRAAFFSHAARVLKPSGRLALSDFVPPEDKVDLLKSFNTSTDEATRRTYGDINVLCSLESYERLAQQVELSLEAEEDISPNTLPTYPFLRKHLQTWEDPADAAFFDKATAQLETACRWGLLRYTILSFQKPASASLRKTA